MNDDSDETDTLSYSRTSIAWEIPMNEPMVDREDVLGSVDDD